MKAKTGTLDRLLFGKAFLLGTTAILWIGVVFGDTNALALTITAVIGGVYGLGVVELLKFRHATSTLSKALDATNGTVAVFSEWLDRLHPSLRNAVRLRVERGRVGLPGPMLTPYLLSLLIMLGLLGTFIGMVDTLRGAVIAIEGTTEIQAIRDGLSAPIKGLGLAFGTSVAGVATSAMLGLMATLSRRQRVRATRRLDSIISAHFRNFSLAHHQRKTFSAIQIQTQTLPQVADKLDALADKLALLSGTLIQNQEQLQASLSGSFSDLADSVDQTFKKSLAEGIRQIGAAAEPIVKDAICDITQETLEVNRSLTQTAKENTEEISRRFAAQLEEMAQSWRAGLEAHGHANGALIDRISRSQNAFREKFNGMAESMFESVQSTSASWLERIETNDRERLDLWAGILGDAQQEAAAYLTNASKTLTGDFERISVSLKQLMQDLADNHQATASRMQNEITRLLTSSEDRVRSRIKAEERWLDGHQKQLDALTVTLGAELGSLREDEERRAQAAVARFENLESVLTSHLATLGQALEAPMSRMMQAASEAPRAAVDIIEHLRQSASKHIQRDNRRLEEHRGMVEKLDHLLTALDLKSTEQGKSIGQLINAAKTMLEDIGGQFGHQVDTEIAKISEVADTFAGSAVEMASLGDAFSVAMDVFNTSNGNLIENLAKIEDALEKASSRSDDQLGYYVAQARELIDHSIQSQREIVLSLQQLRPQLDPDLEAN